VTYDDFLAFVAPSCPSCPRETMLHHIRQAAIKFCERTQVWEEDLDGLLGDGFSTQFTLALDDQVALSKLLEVWVQDSSTARRNQYGIRDAAAGRDAVRNGCEGSIAWAVDRTDVGVYPAPVADAVIDVTATLKPSQASYSFPDHLFEQHARHIAAGALAELLDMPATTWRDSGKAAIEFAKFEDAMCTAGRQKERGYAKRQRSRTERFM
jgi:hypothetical protein